MIKIQNTQSNLQRKIINTMMHSGKKTTSEKILLKSVKRVQKQSVKNFKQLLKSALINTTPTFKVNEQIVKRGKRKSVKVVPSFISGDTLRLTSALKLLKTSAVKSRKSQPFYVSLVDEILSASISKSMAVDKKAEIQSQVLLNKRYLSKFRW